VKTLFFDVDVLLDVLRDRAPGAGPAAALWAAVETRKARGLVTAHAVTTIHGLLKSSRGGAFADRGVSDLLAVFNVARVSEAVLNAALSLRLGAFDDAVSAAAAAAARCDLLVARDPARFRGSPVEVVSPGEALARLSSGRKAAPKRRSAPRE
jgi:predicted nucleic acid-binding protein